ncbi:MAG: TolC family protein, partial [Myxococcales bacterium]
MQLTLEDALRRAEGASALVRRARAERLAVEARDVGARLMFPANPVVAVGAGPRTESRTEQRPEQVSGVGRDSGIQYALHAEQTLEIANQRGTRRTEVARAVEVAGWREALALAETRARVRTLYVGSQLAHAQARSARSREELVQKLVDSVRTRVDAGAASNVDLELARLERGRATRDRITAELAVDVALADLRVLIAAPPALALSLISPLATPAPPAELNVLLARARERRTELRALESSEAMLDAAVVRLRREAVPNPTVFL